MHIYKFVSNVLIIGDMSGWTKIDNTDYKHCKSYPPLFYIPVKASVPFILKSVLQFRFGNVIRH